MLRLTLNVFCYIIQSFTAKKRSFKTNFTKFNPSGLIFITIVIYLRYRNYYKKGAFKMSYREVSDELEKILRLKTAPVAVKLYKDAKVLPKEPVDYKVNLCQLVSTARYQGKQSGGVPELMICSMGASCVGLIDTPEAITSGQAAVGAYCKDIECGKTFMANTFRLGDKGKQYAGINVQPLKTAKEDPDVVVMYVKSRSDYGVWYMACAYDNGKK